MSSLVFHRHTLAHTHTHTRAGRQAGSHNFAFLFLCDIPPPPFACPAPRSYFSVCGAAPGQPELTLPCHAMSPVSCRFIIYALCLLFPAGHLHQAGNKLTQAVPLPQSQQLHSIYIVYTTQLLFSTVHNCSSSTLSSNGGRILFIALKLIASLHLPNYKLVQFN